MKKIFNQCNFYTLLWCYYYWHTSIYNVSSFFSRLVLLLCIILSLFYMLLVIKQYSIPSYLKWLGVLFIMFSIYGYFRYSELSFAVVNGILIDKLYSFKNICISILPIFSYYYFSKKQQLNDKVLRYYSLVFLCICFVTYYSYNMKTRGIELGEMVEYTNNTGYYFLSLLPIMCFWKEKPICQYIYLGVVMIMILLCFKRGAIVSASMCVLAFLYVSLKNTTRRRRLFIFVLSTIFIFLVYFFVSYLLETSDYFNLRVAKTLEGDANGREEMYPLFLNFLLNQADLRQLIYGSGFDGSLKLFGQYCHNDWFEMLIDHGFIGFTLYIFYWLSFFQSLRLKKLRSANDYYLPMLLLFILLFCNTLYSFSINSMYIYETCVLGFCVSSSSSSRKKYQD